MDILAVADERAGVRNQAQGLAEALATQVGGQARLLVVSSKDRKRFAPLTQAVPDIAIGCGRAAQAELVGLRRRGAKTVYVQDPRSGYGRFDLVVAPRHDGVMASNAIPMTGGPHRVDAERLGEAAKAWESLDALPSPKVAVMVGGKSGRHDFDADVLAAHTKAMAEVLALGGSLMISVSRRTDDVIADGFARLAERHPTRVRVYRGDGPNPYLGFLAHAEVVLVTEDSANMLVEACATGVPVFRLPMAGSAGKFGALYADLEDKCHVRRWDGSFAAESYAPLEETARVAGILAERLQLTVSRT